MSLFLFLRRRLLLQEFEKGIELLIIQLALKLRHLLLIFLIFFILTHPAIEDHFLDLLIRVLFHEFAAFKLRPLILASLGLLTVAFVTFLLLEERRAVF